MRETANIISIQNNIAKIKLVKSKACDGCGACSAFSKERMFDLNIPKDMNIKAGDNIIIEINTQNFLYVTFMIYFMPILVLVLGYVVGSTIEFFNMGKELRGIIGVVVFEIIYFLVLYIFSSRKGAPVKIIGVCSEDK